MNAFEFLHFPESHHPAPSELARGYSCDVFNGFQEMQKRCVVIAMVLQSRVEHIPVLMARMESLGECFADYRVVVVDAETDIDNSEQLDRWSLRNSKVHLVRPSGGVRLAQDCFDSPSELSLHYHARCQTEIAERFADCDHVILIDPNVAGGWSPDGLASTFSRTDWDYVGSYGIQYRRVGMRPNEHYFYDTKAYRSEEGEIEAASHVQQLKFERGQAWIPVLSCFGGVGIYRSEAYFSGRYYGCEQEQIAFHLSMRRNGFDRIYLNPSQIVVYGRATNRFDGIVKRLNQILVSMKLKRYERWRFERKELECQAAELANAFWKPAVEASPIASENQYRPSIAA